MHLKCLQKIYKKDANWRELTKRLPKVNLLTVSECRLKRINKVNLQKKTNEIFKQPISVLFLFSVLILSCTAQTKNSLTAV